MKTTKPQPTDFQEKIEAIIGSRKDWIAAARTMLLARDTAAAYDRSIEEILSLFRTTMEEVIGYDTCEENRFQPNGDILNYITHDQETKNQLRKEQRQRLKKLLGS